MTMRSVLSRLGLVAVAPLISSPRLQARSPSSTFPETISLPNGFRPEGVVIGSGATIYAGSIPTGAIYQADLGTGKGSLLVPPQSDRQAIGLDFDRRTNILYVAGGPTGAAYAYDAGTGDTIAVFQLTTESPTFVNDQIVVSDAVYFTDSQRPVIYRVPLSKDGELSPDAISTEIQLGGDFTFVPGVNNANGIETSPRGTDLIVVNSFNGVLYRVDPNTGFATSIDLGGASLTNGDGLLRRDDELFVVQNRLNQIALVELDRLSDSGEIKRIITDSRFDVPTTVDRFRRFLYVVNARFNTPPMADTTYTIVKVPATSSVQ